MNPFRTVPDRLLSLWQSTVEFIFRSSPESYEPASEGTARYVERVHAFPYLEGMPDALAIWNDLGEQERQSAFHHQTALAEFFGNLPLLRRLRPLRPYEEGARNARLWNQCVDEYLAHLSRVAGGVVEYRSPIFRGRVTADFSVLTDALPEVATVGVVGDWGTGQPLATHVMRGLIEQQPDVIVHLGDIYASGTRLECETAFAAIIRDTLKYEGPVYTLAGNHDYYSGGDGYYHLLDHLNPSTATRQAASYFCLRNKYWQLLAMDTGHNDCVPLPLKYSTPFPPIDMSKTPLRQDEIEWLRYQLDHAEHRRTILLSHHQFTSAYTSLGNVSNGATVNPALRDIFSPYFDVDRGIIAWLWGHEHDFVEFTPHHGGLYAGLCLGHGAIPVWRGSRPGEPRYAGVSWKADANPLGRDSSDYFNRGFSLLRLRGPSANLEHFEVNTAGAATPFHKTPIY